MHPHQSRQATRHSDRLGLSPLRRRIAGASRRASGGGPKEGAGTGLDDGINDDEARHHPVGGPVAVPAREGLRPGVAGRDVEEGREGLVEHVQPVRAPEDRHRDHGRCPRARPSAREKGTGTDCGCEGGPCTEHGAECSLLHESDSRMHKITITKKNYTTTGSKRNELATTFRILRVSMYPCSHRTDSEEEEIHEENVEDR